MPLLDREALRVIEEIHKRGNDAEVRRKGDGFIILEVTKKIKYTSCRSGQGKGNGS